MSRVSHSDVVFRTAYDGFSDDSSLNFALETPEASLAQQQFADEADINTIVRNFLRTGEAPFVDKMPKYGDFTGVQDYHSALNAVIAADDAFMSLPADLRARFNNDAGAMLNFLSDPANREEAIELGLLSAESPLPEAPKKHEGRGDDSSEEGDTPPSDDSSVSTSKSRKRGGKE